MALSITHVNHQGVDIFHLDGDLSQSYIAEVSDQLRPFLENPSKLLLNLEKVNLIDSSGITVLVSCHRKLANQHGHFGICHVSKNMMQIIRLAGLDTVLTLYENTEKALETLLE